MTCPSCGSVHYLNPKPCANAIVVAGERILLVRRAHGPWHGSWCAPGGFCEVGEHPVETAERETFEETGQPIEVTGYLGVWVDVYDDEPDRVDADVINVGYYVGTPVDGPHGPVDPREVGEVAWFGWDELPAMLAPPETLAAVLAAARAGITSPRADHPR